MNAIDFILEDCIAIVWIWIFRDAHLWNGKPQDEWEIQNLCLDLFTFLIGVAYFNKTPQTEKLFTKEIHFFF